MESIIGIVGTSSIRAFIEAPIGGPGKIGRSVRTASMVADRYPGSQIVGFRRDEVSELLIRLATVLPSAKGRGESSSSVPYGCLYQPYPGRALAAT